MIDNNQTPQSQSNKLEIELLKRDFQLFEKLIEKISESIEKTQQLDIQLGKIISVHEQKHKQHQLDHIELKREVRDMEQEINVVKKEITEHINKVEQRISDKLDHLTKELNDTQRQQSENKNNFSDFLRGTDKFTYMVWGAIIVLSWVVSNVNLSSLSTLFK